MSLGVFSFRLSVSTKQRRRVVAPQIEDIPLDLLITQSGENIHTQDSRNVALNHRIVTIEDLPLDLLITQSGENIHTQDSRNVALNHRIVKLLLTEDLNTIITQSGDFIDTTE